MHYKIGIEVHPTVSEPKTEIPLEKKKSSKKWRFPWRINMLAMPKWPVQKYEPPPPGPEIFKVFGPVDPEIEFRADHLARPFVRKLYENRHLFEDLGPNYVKTMNKIIDKSWDAIYNFYKKILRSKELARLKRKIDKKKAEAKKLTKQDLEKIAKMKEEYLLKIATPKKIFLPPTIPRQSKPLEELLTRIEKLATPVVRIVQPPRELGVVSKAAQNFITTEFVTKLALLPKWRMALIPKKAPPEVTPSKLCVKGEKKIYKCPSRIARLAMPSSGVREAKAKKLDDDKYDPFVVSKAAQNCIPRPRILELAKPIERD